MPQFDATVPFLVNIIESFTTALFVIAKSQAAMSESVSFSRVTNELTSTQHVGRARGSRPQHRASQGRRRSKATNEDALELRRFHSGCEVIGHIPTFAGNHDWTQSGHRGHHCCQHAEPPRDPAHVHRQVVVNRKDSKEDQRNRSGLRTIRIRAEKEERLASSLGSSNSSRGKNRLLTLRGPCHRKN